MQSFMHTFHEVGISLDELLAKLDKLIQVIDLQGNLLYANPHWLFKLNYAETDVQSINFIHDILHPRQRSVFVSLLATLSASKQVKEVQLHLLTRSGQTLIAQGSIIPRIVDDKVETVVCVLRDITLSQQVETELDRMFKMSMDMLGIANFEGYFERLNPAWEQILGYSMDELLSQRFIGLVYPDDITSTEDMMRAAIEKDTVDTFENRYVCKNGEFRWISWHYISYTENRKIYFVARDITEQKQQIQLVHEAKEQLQSIIDNSGLMVGLKDLDGHYILVNAEFSRQVGITKPADMLGKTDFELFPLSIAKQLRANDTDVLRMHRTMQFEEYLPEGGQTRTYLTTKFTLDDVNANPYAVGLIGKDITERKKTEIELLLRNKAIEQSPSAISIVDAQSYDMPLIYINPAFEKITGYTPDDVLGCNCRFLQGNDRDQPEIQQMREVIRNQQSITVILRNYRKDGTLFYNEMSLAPIHDENGQLTHYVGISTDVTERMTFQQRIQKQNEALIETNQKLLIARREAEEATRLKSEFLATMSHELRTPLNAIIGYTEIQLAGMTGELTEEQQHYQERVLAKADHLLKLINDILDIAKIEAGRLEMVRKPFNLSHWLADIEAEMRVLAQEKELDFIVRLDKRMPRYVVGDAARIKQIVVNLLSNAIKFTHEGSVRLKIRKHGRDAWKLIVEDTGIGIASHMQETIFEAFRQVDSSFQRKVGGTGLGLSIVRELVLRMGGNVRVKSNLGEGSTFTVILPMIEAPGAAATGEFYGD
jgi:PAS domain S-box-containing protein